MSVWINGIACTDWGSTTITLSSATDKSFTFKTDVLSSTLRIEFADYTSFRSAASGATNAYCDYTGPSSDTFTCTDYLAGKTLNIWCDYLWHQPYVAVTFTAPPEVTYPTGITASQNDNGTTDIKWNACTGSGGTGSESLTYSVHKGDNGAALWSGSATTATLNINNCFGYGSSVQIYVRSYYGTADEWNYITKTFTAPYITEPTNLKLTKTLGRSTTLSWSAAYLKYTSSSSGITYTILKDGDFVGTSTSTSFDITEDIAQEFGTDPVTLTVKASATDLTNTYSGPTLNKTSSGVSFTYAVISECISPTTFAVSQDLSYTPVNLEWSEAEDGIENTITSYYIQYQDCADNSTWPDTWLDLETDCVASHIEVSPPDAIGSYRRFRIQVKGSAGEDYYSDWLISSNSLRKDMAPFEGFTDPEMVQLGTKIKAVHMTEMQNRINDLLLFSGEEAFSFTEIIAGETRLSGWTSHVIEIREATDRIRTSHEDWIEITENRPRVDIMTQLRDVLVGYCKVTITVDGENGLPEGCIVTVRNTEDNSVIAEFEYTEPKMIRIPPGTTFRVECSKSDDYTVSPVSSVMVAQENAIVNIELMYRNAMRYGFRREKANPDPAARITYLYDAEGMTPMYVDLTTGAPNYGSWQMFIDEVCRPVMLRYDGTVDYELDHSDQTKKLDGTASDVANTAYEGNAMVEFRKYKWVKRYEDENFQYVIFSDAQYDDTYHAYAHTNANGNVQNAFYWGMFEGTYSNNRLRSIGTGALMTGQTRATDISRAQANGSGTDQTTNGWYLIYKSGWDYVCDLLTLLSKTDNSQAAFGSGRSATGNTAASSVGWYKTKPAFCGYSSGTECGKALYIESMWGNAWEPLAGFIMDKSGVVKTKMTPPYNTTGDGYTTTDVQFGNISGSYVIQNVCSDITGYIPLTVGGSQNTYMCDALWSNIGETTYAYISGAHNDGEKCGSRFLSLYSPVTHKANNCTARLSYLNPKLNDI